MNRKSRSRLAADWFAKLRINLQTQEVEHEDVSDVKEEVDTSVASEMAALDSEKADLSYVDNAIDNMDLSLYALKDLSNVESLPASVQSDLKGETGATFSISGSVLTITTP